MSDDTSKPNEESPAADTAKDDLHEGQSTADVSSPEPDLEAELADANGRAMRAQAELENFRKRMRREMEESEKFAAMPLLRELLPVVDDMERAIAAAEKSEDSAGLLAGVKMVESRLRSALQQHGCERIEAEGKEFDPAKHEAILMQPTNDCDPGKVMQVTQQGYQLHQRVIRPAQVIVAKQPAEQPAE